MRKKLKYNHDRFIDERNKITYMNLRTTKKAAKYMKNFLQRLNVIITVEKFLNKMRERFGDFYVEKTVKNEYRKLYQKKRPLFPFLKDFHRWAFMTNINEKDQLMNFRDKINDILHDFIIEHDFQNFNSMIEFLIKTDKRHEKKKK